MKNERPAREAQINAQVVALMQEKVQESLLRFLLADGTLEAVGKALDERDAVQQILGAAR